MVTNSQGSWRLEVGGGLTRESDAPRRATSGSEPGPRELTPSRPGLGNETFLGRLNSQFAQAALRRQRGEQLVDRGNRRNHGRRQVNSREAHSSG